MSNLTSSLTVKLIDDVSRPARTVAQALRDAERAAKDVAKGMAGTGATDKFVKSLSGLKLAKKDIEQVAAAWKDYARSAGLAANSSQWTKKQIADVHAWERNTLSALRTVKREQASFAKSIGKMGGVSPMMLAMSQGVMANKKLISGMSGAGMIVLPDEGKGRKRRRGGLGGAAAAEAEMIGAAELGALGGFMSKVPFAGVAGGYLGYKGAEKMIHSGMEYQHEKIALQNAGRTISELNEMEEAAKRAAKAVPTSSVKENLAILNETTGAFGSTEHALENLEFMARTASVLKAATGDKISDSPGELGNKFARFMEMRGVAQNSRQVQSEGDALTRAMVFSRGNFNPAEMLNFGQQAKSSLQNYNKEFLTEKLPSIITEFGGDRSGTMANSFFATLMGRVRDKTQTAQWVKAGLIDPSMVVGGKSGPISWKAGAVKDTDLAMRDPVEWAGKVLIPALQKAGINTENNLEVTKALATMFRNSTANQFANVITQANSRQRILKDQQLMNQAGTPEEIYKRNLSGDPSQGVAAVKAAYENLSAAVLKSAPLAEGLNSLANGINNLSSATERAGKFWDALNTNKTILGAWNDSAPKNKSFGEAFSKYSVPDTRPTFTKPAPQAGPMGVTGGISASPAPAFTRMQATPSVDTSQLDAAKAKADEAHAAVEGLNLSATPNVNSASIDAAIAKANQLRAILGSIGAAAASASSAVSSAAASATSAAASIKSASAVAKSNYVSGGVQGGN